MTDDELYASLVILGFKDVSEVRELFKCQIETNNILVEKIQRLNKYNVWIWETGKKVDRGSNAQEVFDYVLDVMNYLGKKNE